MLGSAGDHCTRYGRAWLAGPPANLIHDYAVAFGHLVPAAYVGAAEWIPRRNGGVFGWPLGCVADPGWVKNHYPAVARYLQTARMLTLHA